MAAGVSVPSPVVSSSGVTALFVGLFGDIPIYRDLKHRAEGIALERKQRGGQALHVEFYQSETAEVWGSAVHPD